MATVKTYSLKRDGDDFVSDHFRVREFRCHDGSDKILICEETVDLLEKIRSYFGKPITINSAYRTPAYNKSVGGASASQHVKGTACDIVVKDVPSWAVAGFVEKNYPIHGIGYYSTFTHVDSRGYGVKWKDYGSNVMGTFGIGDNYKVYKAKVETVQKPVEKPAPKGDDEVTQTDFNKMYSTMISEMASKEPSNWDDLGKAIEWAKEKGIIKGDKSGNLMMQKPLTRQEMVLMLYRASKQ